MWPTSAKFQFCTTKNLCSTAAQRYVPDARPHPPPPWFCRQTWIRQPKVQPGVIPVLTRPEPPMGLPQGQGVWAQPPDHT